MDERRKGTSAISSNDNTQRDKLIHFYVFFLLLYCAVPVLGYAAAIKMNVLGTRYGIGESNNQKC